MQYRLSFEERPTLAVAATPCELIPAQIEVASIRLRSWALIREAGVGGRAFLRIESRAKASCCLPLVQLVSVHPDTGINVEHSPPGPIVRVATVQLFSLFQELELLVERLAPNGGLRAVAELHFPDRGMSEGQLVLPLHRLPTVRPVLLTVTQVPAR